MTTDKKKDIATRVRALLDETKERDAYVERMLATRSQTPAAGDIYRFPLEQELPLLWAILKDRTATDDSMFVVPADIDPIAGTGDLRLPPLAACGPLTLRCGLGTWLPAKGFGIGQRVGFIEDVYIAAASQMLQALATGEPLPGDEVAEQIDLAPAYRNWIAVLSQCTESVRSAIEEHATQAALTPAEAPHNAPSTSPSVETDDLVQAISAMVRGGETPRQAVKRLSRLISDTQARAALVKYERATGRIRALAEPQALVGQNEPEAWYIGPQPDDRFWPALEQYLRDVKGWGPDAIGDLDRASTKTLALMPPPGLGKFSARGLTLGYVQSGKTANYTALIAKAADASYRFFIVLSGLHNGLRAQTQRRLDQELVHLVPSQWHTLTTEHEDFRGQGNVNALLGGDTQKVLCVVKKNTFVLQRLLKWLRGANDFTLRNCPVLIIDDEADQASVNASGAEERRTQINNLILKLLERLPKASYVGFTATPFANLFIDPKIPEDLYPRDFIVDLPRPAAYFGPERIFGRQRLTQEETDVDGLDMIRHVPDAEVPLLKPRGHSDQALFQPEMTSSLEDAIKYFWLASAARRAAGHLQASSASVLRHASMLIHTTLYADVHSRLSREVTDFRTTFLDQLRRNDRKLLKQLRETWADELGKIPVSVGGIREPFEVIREHLLDVVEMTSIVVENSRSVLRLEYGEDPTIQIVIGGNTLSRGLTLEGLTVSFFVRASTAYDTLLQMGRWFGYRPGYENLPRIWMTEELEKWFFHLALVEQEIRSDIRRYEIEHLTPQQLAVRVRTHPQLSITSSLKMQHAVDSEVSYAGRHVQTILFSHREKKWLETNLRAGKELIKRARASGIAVECVRDRFWLLRDVPVAQIRSFLSTYQFHDASQEVRGDLIKDYIAQQNKRDALLLWNVAIVGKRRAPNVPELEFDTDLKVPMLVRSRLRRLPGDANIGVLTSAQDVVADLEKQPSDLRELDKAELMKLRDEPDDKSRRGLLLLYPISKDSAPDETESPMRKPLEAVEHLLGVAMVFPGVPQDEDTPRKYKSVQLPILFEDVEKEELPAEEEAAS
jgi:hypothetical protein